jgi:hypothetical protein
MLNPYTESLRPIWDNPRCVHLDDKALGHVAEQIATQDLPIPNWRNPVFPENDVEFVDFIGLGNAINFAFTDFETFESFRVGYGGTVWRGAFGMWACLKRALDAGVPILDGTYLRDLTFDDFQELFRGENTIPLLRERWQIFNEVGFVLCQKFDGRFRNLFDTSNYQALGEGGVVARLVNDFPSFRDETVHCPTGNLLRFHKRAQLLAMMYQGRALNSDSLQLLPDFQDLGPIADYAVPRSLHTLGVLKYVDALWDTIRARQLVAKDSVEEQELRGQTVLAQLRLMASASSLRGESVNILQLDYKLWAMGRDSIEPHHLTVTTAY